MLQAGLKTKKVMFAPDRIPVLSELALALGGRVLRWMHILAASLDQCAGPGAVPNKDGEVTSRAIGNKPSKDDRLASPASMRLSTSSR